MKAKPVKIIVSVSNDISYDQRVNRVCATLVEAGFQVLLVGRKLRQSIPLDNRPYESKRLSLLVRKGFWFYAELNLRLFIFLIFKRFNFLLANDLDTLPANALTSLFRRRKLFYDSHELFTEVPELNNRRFVKSIWSFIEKLSLKRVFRAYTVCDSIATYYRNKYEIDFATIKNLPFYDYQKVAFNLRSNLIIYQGALNKDRGLELMIGAMQHIDHYELAIAGAGDIEEPLRSLIKELGLENKVHLHGKLQLEELTQLTRTCKLGLSLERNTNLNYYYALPNKIFDYINAGVPVLCSNLPEMTTVVKKHRVGEIFEGETAFDLAQTINKLLKDNRLLETYHQNCYIASKELNWDKEKEILKEIFL